MEIVYVGALSEGILADRYRFRAGAPFHVPDAFGAALCAEQPSNWQPFVPFAPPEAPEEPAPVAPASPAAGDPFTMDT